MKHAASRDLHGYWNGLRADRTAPERRDVDPAAIRHILAQTFVLDASGVDARGKRVVTFRLSGTRVDALFGRDLRGGTFGTLWAESAMGMMASMLDGVLEERCGVVAAIRGAPPGHLPIDLELLLLPLRHHGRTHDRILGSLATAAAPGWLGLRSVGALDIVSFRTLASPPPEPRLERLGAATRDVPCLVAAGPARPGTVPPGTVQVGRFTVYQGGRAGPRPAVQRP